MNHYLRNHTIELSHWLHLHYKVVVAANLPRCVVQWRSGLGLRGKSLT